MPRSMAGQGGAARGSRRRRARTSSPCSSRIDGVDSRERLRRRAGLHGRDAGERRDEDHPGLRLPPRVHHGRVAGADHLAVPHPGLGVDRLADAAQQPERRSGCGSRRARGPTSCATGSRSGPCRGCPPCSARRCPTSDPARGSPGAFVQHARRSVAERPVDDVAVAGDPADVGGAPVHRVGLDVEDVVVGRSRRPRGSRRSCGRSPSASRSCRSCTAGRGDPPSPSARMGTSRGAGSPFERQGVPVDVAAFLQAGPAAGAPRDDDGAHARAALERLVGVLLERNLAALAPPLVLRDQHLAAHVVQPVRERLRAERRRRRPCGAHRAARTRASPRAAAGSCPCRSRPACPCERRAP